MVKPRENRVPIMMSEEELQAIDDWRFANRIATRSDAVRRLVQLGILFDEDADNLTKAMVGVYDLFTQRAVAAAGLLVDESTGLDGRQEEYIRQMNRLAVDTIEELHALMHSLNSIVAPRDAIKANEPFEQARLGFLAAKAEAAAALLQQKIDVYELKKKRDAGNDIEDSGL
ncbi:hypothetical protein [Neorhizobium petrolearium]|uniref:CopG family transcriptional regulator n=1 Tax=Neorhizobium petrolearium TaxID=515361 RepID=A0ABY8M1C1_9HYPH|nr:hypothetical protein [Neorhizobium petrolearium]MCC2612623.1 hypothetical protein [Neorhizobium petrolearium]WGI67746.1 hypothetical protein QEO92_22615 [Neorhizobium petrolearium]